MSEMDEDEYVTMAGLRAAVEIIAKAIADERDRALATELETLRKLKELGEIVNDILLHVEARQ